MVKTVPIALQVGGDQLPAAIQAGEELREESLLNAAARFRQKVSRYLYTKLYLGLPGGPLGFHERGFLGGPESLFGIRRSGGGILSKNRTRQNPRLTYQIAALSQVMGRGPRMPKARMPSNVQGKEKTHPSKKPTFVRPTGSSQQMFLKEKPRKR